MSREDDSEEGFLSRWSRKKSEQQQATPQPQQKAEPEQQQPTNPVSESAADKELPIWQRQDVDAETKLTALRELFRKPEFNTLDKLNEYDDDFTSFPSLGNIVTHEMKRMLKLAQEKTSSDDISDEGQNEPAAREDTPINSEDSTEHSSLDDENEDKDLA